MEVSGELLIALLDQSQDCIKLLGPTGHLDYMNRNGLCAMEIGDLAQVAGKAWWEIWPVDAEPAIRHAIAEARAGRHARFEAFCPTTKGAPRWWEVSVSPVNDRDGRLVGIVAISRDVSERVAAREQLATMAHEMRHRLRNAYAISASLTRMSARAHPDHLGFATGLSDRFAQLGIAQSRLVDAAVDGDRLTSLIPALTAAFGGDSGELVIVSLPDVEVGEQAMRAIALLLGELCTNSLKHGALSCGGRVEISGEMQAQTLVLHWTERSDGASAGAPTHHGDGLQLMRRIVEAHAGTLEIDWRADGLDVTATLQIG